MMMLENSTDMCLDCCISYTWDWGACGSVADNSILLWCDTVSVQSSSQCFKGLQFLHHLGSPKVPWWWRHNGHLKCWELCTQWHSVTSKKSWTLNIVNGCLKIF